MKVFLFDQLYREESEGGSMEMYVYRISYLLSWRGGGRMEVGVSIFLPSGLERGQTLVLTTPSSLREKERSTRAITE
jgi:hypothetical protein